ncbi:Cof-type HAD-IIB family hydrolase [Heyndrickxia sporothermodurans]
MTQYKIVFLDIDGTVLRPDNIIEESTKKAIAEVQEKGLEVLLATGRPLHEISHIAKELNIHSYIGYNGAYAVYKGKDVLKKPMDTNIVQLFLSIAKDQGNEVVMYTNEKNLFTALEESNVKNFIDKFHMKKNEIYSNKYLDSILGMTLIKLNENDPSLYEKEEDIHLSRVNVKGLTNNYDVIRDTVNKGIAVKAVLDLLEINRENAIAFGDGMNDKEMLSYVGEGFAMGNADPSLLKYAKHQTSKVTDSGIYNGLKSLGLLDN